MLYKIPILIDALPVAVVIVKPTWTVFVGVDRVIRPGITEVFFHTSGQALKPVAIKRASQEHDAITCKLIDIQLCHHAVVDAMLPPAFSLLFTPPFSPRRPQNNSLTAVLLTRSGSSA